ncbi:lysophospholipid acyltransferase 7-like isoform X2 [Hydractinia symbiolongicarpus]|uniref:lysophospholipid acyltransferase 7-like isoform X2 n=1 Tax=Hydractinia symbiolongicarpus TaxID=13093 RepID=UPI00254B37BD|nr:lysophospholipid acyltransferase 7-like isoform X2 [Hydractinia symbiolongicarpus]
MFWWWHGYCSYSRWLERNDPLLYCSTGKLCFSANLWTKMINLAFEYHDANERKESKDDSWEKFRIKKEFSASLFDYFAYGYCYIGLMTGPFYTYQTFQDMLYQDGKKISTVWPAIRNLKYLPVIAIPYLVLKSKFPLEYLESEECLQQGMIHTLLVMVPVMAWFRWRFYIGWLLAESMCMSAGLGAYPFECKAKPGLGPTYAIPSGVDSEKSAKQHDGDTHDFATTHNIEIFHCEYSGSLKSTMKIWNMTVQWWMATYIYKKLSIKSNQIRMVLLLAVSAYWHGLHAGYYASFLSAPLFIFAETRISQRVTPYLSESQKYWWSWLTWFFVFRYLEYIAIPFMFLKFEVLWKIWSRIYFCGHVWTIALVFISMLIPVKKSEKKSN